MTILGMAALGTGILGAPLTMTCLALELTGDLGITVASLIVCSFTALVVRETFGYSFATWRFHLRGESIRGPHDVGWVRDLRVGRLMRRDVRTVAAAARSPRRASSSGANSAKEIAVTDKEDRYVGLVVTSDLHSTTLPGETPLAALAQLPGRVPPADDADPQGARHVREGGSRRARRGRRAGNAARSSGWLSEAHALRRYGQELEKRNRENIGG